jgi:hypothetical protein
MISSGETEACVELEWLARTIMAVKSRSIEATSLSQLMSAMGPKQTFAPRWIQQ